MSEEERSALRIALTYAAVAGVWIAFSDRLVAALATDPAQLEPGTHATVSVEDTGTGTGGARRLKSTDLRWDLSDGAGSGWRSRQRATPRHPPPPGRR